MQKKLVTLILPLVLVASACGSNATESTSAVNETNTSTTLTATTTAVEATTPMDPEPEVPVEEADEEMAREEMITQLLEVLEEEEDLPVDVSDFYDFAACVVDGVSEESGDNYATMLETTLDDEEAYGSESDDILPGCWEELESFLEEELSDSNDFISEPIRIEFTSGSNGASVEGELTAESLHTYVLGASAGQTMTVWLDSPEKTAVVHISTPEGYFLTSGNLFGNRNYDIFVTLPEDGDYYLDIYLQEDPDTFAQLSEEVPYELTVFVEEEIETQSVQFLPGDSWAMIEGGVLQGERGQFYELTASTDQAMLITIESLEDNAVYDVISPSGNILLQEKTGESTAMIVLPEDGEYLIWTGSSRGNSSYTLTVDIWNIPFVETVLVEEFGRTVTLEGGSLQGEPGPVYVVPIEEGLKYAISVTSLEDNAVINLVAPNGDVLVSEDTGLIGTAFEGGDYLIQVGGTRGNVSYALEVTLGIE